MSHRVNWYAVLNTRWVAMLTVMIIGIVAARTGQAQTMQIKRLNDQLILSGPVGGADIASIKDALAESPHVHTIVLRNSPGGDAPAGYEVGALFRERGLNTAVSGFCYSACSRMFLGGAQRYFTDDYRLEYTNVGLHGHYDREGRLDANLVHQLGLKDWIIRYSDGKADAALVERWTSILVSQGLIHFFHPGRIHPNGMSTFFCTGFEPTVHWAFGCEPIPKTALDLGIATSLTLIHSSDQAELRVAMPTPPSPSGYAAIDDISKLPLITAQGLAGYQRFLRSAFPRAFAISPGGAHWAWKGSSMDDVSQLALSRCAESAHTTCQLYANDDEVVWVVGH